MIICLYGLIGLNPNSNDLGSHKNTLVSRKLNKNTNRPN